MIVVPATNAIDGSRGWLYNDRVSIHEDILYRIIDIDRDRYGGCYSGGTYTAWPGIRPSDLDAGDIDCEHFWRDHGKEALHGAGDTAQAALIDLLVQIESGNFWSTENLAAVIVNDPYGASEPVRAFSIDSPAFANWINE